MSMEDPAEALRQIGALPDERIDLAEAALMLACFERARVPLDRYRDHLAELARDVADQLAAVPVENVLEQRVGALNTVLFQLHGYAGDRLTYDDLQNANLMRVIDRRRGLPVALAILYIHAARAQGWEIEGLNFPGHFLVRLHHDGGRAIIDPFAKGQLRQVSDLREMIKASAGEDAELSAEHYAAVGNRDILLRLQNNIKLRLLQSDQLPAAVLVLERMLLIAPNEAALWRESGMLHAKAGNLRAAITALERFTAVATNDLQRHRAALLLQELKSKLN